MSLFVTFEGPDGSGKSTQINLVVEHLSRLGYRVLCTREPGGTAIGNQIRQVLHDVSNTEMSARAEILLYSASRAQLVEQVILPHLAHLVAYRFVRPLRRQHRSPDIPHDYLVTQGLTPDLTIYLDLPPALMPQIGGECDRRGRGSHGPAFELAFISVSSPHLKWLQRTGALAHRQCQRPGRSNQFQIICRRLEQVLAVTSRR